MNKRNNSPHRIIEINLLISVLLSLVINFSYLVSLNLNLFPGGGSRHEDRRMERRDERRSPERDRRNSWRMEPSPREEWREEEWREERPPREEWRDDSLSMDGNLREKGAPAPAEALGPGAAFPDRDRRPANTPGQRNSYRQNQALDSLAQQIPTIPDSLDNENYVRERSIKEHYDRFDPWKYYQKQYQLLMVYEGSYFLLFSFILLTLATARMGKSNRKNRFLIRVVLCLGATAMLYFLAPQMTWRGRIILTMQAYDLYNPMLMLKVIIVFIVAVMYSKIYELIFQRQTMAIENEQLKNENLVSQYTVLVNQINPHFFFNSLNSLAMLIRENRNEAAQTYINELSHTFRYIIQESKNNTTTLEDELKFVESYKYLFEIRYAGKFFVKIDVEENMLHRILPAFSLQPLIENAVKHNTITKLKPLTITITTKDEHLIVSNPIMPKIDDSEIGTGIGLTNLESRYMLIMNKPVIVENDGVTFTVKLPLSKNKE